MGRQWAVATLQHSAHSDHFSAGIIIIIIIIITIDQGNRNDNDTGQPDHLSIP